jgi:PKD repeat protein
MAIGHKAQNNGMALEHFLPIVVAFIFLIAIIPPVDSYDGSSCAVPGGQGGYPDSSRVWAHCYDVYLGETPVMPGYAELNTTAMHHMDMSHGSQAIVYQVNVPTWQWNMGYQLDFSRYNTISDKELGIVTHSYHSPTTRAWQVEGMTLDPIQSDDYQTGETLYDSAPWTNAIYYKTWILQSGTRPAPTANFIASPLSGTAPLSVYFTETSDDTSDGSLAKWNWTFGDGAYSVEQNPSHTYTAAGTYDVSLTVMNSGGSDTEMKVGYISVTNSGPIANFTATPTNGYPPLTVAFTDISTGSPTTWNWTFGDGAYSAEQNPSHTYTAAGTYDVSLTATNAGGSDTKTKAGFVTVTCPDACDATLTNPPYINFGIYNVSCPEENSGAWHPAVCVDNTLIRWAMAGKSTPFYTTLSPWMWKRSSCCPNPGYSWAVDSPANKPIYYAAVTNPDMDVKFGWHAVAAEYLGAGDVEYSTWQDWKFFNYYELDIQRGWDQQIPNGTSSFNTTVRIDNISGVYGCGQYYPSSVRAFTIDRNNSVSPVSVSNYAPGYLLSKTGKTQFKNQKIPDDLKNVMRSMNYNGQFTISKWEFDPTTEELTLYAYDINNPRVIDNFQAKLVGKYSIRVVHDTEFEKNRADVQQRLLQLRKNPDYQIAWIAMHTDTINDPPENYVELWAYKSTPENKKLDNTVIKGWKILVYPVSQPPSDMGKI